MQCLFIYFAIGRFVPQHSSLLYHFAAPFNRFCIINQSQNILIESPTENPMHTTIFNFLGFNRHRPRRCSLQPLPIAYKILHVVVVTQCLLCIFPLRGAIGIHIAPCICSHSKSQKQTSRTNNKLRNDIPSKLKPESAKSVGWATEIGDVQCSHSVYALHTKHVQSLRYSRIRCSTYALVL